ncbi:MAG: hypothetical protein K8U57_39810 [Planctomycetes bacterium]|nr:hypothetical protein [Planctomycetota bacterium]
MKRILAMFLILIGAVVGVFGAYHLFTGGPHVLLPFTRDFYVSPMYIALAGLTSFTLGIIGYRD